MKNATDRHVRAIHTKNFDKYLAVTNPKNGDEFMKEVCALYMTYEVEYRVQHEF
jgi:hypothetical protein